MGGMRSLVTLRYVFQYYRMDHSRSSLAQYKDFSTTVILSDRLHENDLEGNLPTFVDAINLEEAQ